ncbi:MAG: DUF2914 domain-containing protein [Polyangiaceae bacterium]|jgi:hypothetical protein|nr:DUF2914 domain-containing protein [Polyangiaceae bacterium]MBK8938873.1 DUF2914 domain-containing protein [Polyangiaceae bacterium]
MRAGEAWLALALLAACGGEEGGATSSGPRPSAPPLVAPSASGPSYEEETGGGALELLRFTFTSAVKAKDPVDELKAAKPGQRVYAHLTLRNRTGKKRTVNVSFKVNGEERTNVDLDIEASWSWRTWAYNTVLPTDGKGTLELVVTDEEGNPLVESTLPIKT